MAFLGDIAGMYGIIFSEAADRADLGEDLGDFAAAAADAEAASFNCLPPETDADADTGSRRGVWLVLVLG